MRRVSPGIVLMGVIVLAVATPQVCSAEDTIPAPPFSGTIGKVLMQKVVELRTGIAADPKLLQAVRESNATHATLSLRRPSTLYPSEEIETLDRQWMNGGVEDMVRALVTNECAQRLVAFQGLHSGYAEIFVADGLGLNVCQTNRTSDYYQADEAWWINSYAGGQGKISYGKIEYDESAMVESIAVFVPIMDPETRQAIGVMKGVIDLTVIKGGGLGT